MDSALLVHRIHFAFTVTFHYLFPQLTMGLAPLIVVLKTIALRRSDEIYNQAARFWARIIASVSAFSPAAATAATSARRSAKWWYAAACDTPARRATARSESSGLPVCSRITVAETSSARRSLP